MSGGSGGEQMLLEPVDIALLGIAWMYCRPSIADSQLDAVLERFLPLFGARAGGNSSGSSGGGGGGGGGDALPSLGELFAWFDAIDTETAAEHACDEGTSEAPPPPLAREFAETVWQLSTPEDVAAIIRTLDGFLLGDTLSAADERDPELARHLHDSTILGWHVRSRVTAFDVLDFAQRARVWERFMRYRETTAERAREIGVYEKAGCDAGDPPVLQLLESLTADPEEASGVDVADGAGEDTAAVALSASDAAPADAAAADKFRRARAMADVPAARAALYELRDAPGRADWQLMLEQVLLHASLGQMSEALRCADEAIMIARRGHNLGAVARIALLVADAIHNHPDVQLPSTFGTREQLRRYLSGAGFERGAPAARAQWANLRLASSVRAELGNPQDLIESYVLSIMALSVLGSPDMNAQLAFHRSQAQLWRRLGKGLLVSEHEAAIEGMLDAPAVSDKPSTWFMIKADALTRHALDGSTAESLKRFAELAERVRKMPTETQAAWRTSLLLVKVLHAVKTLQFPQARVLLAALARMPNLDYYARDQIHACEARLLLATDCAEAALELAKARYEEAVTVARDAELAAAWINEGVRAVLQLPIDAGERQREAAAQVAAARSRAGAVPSLRYALELIVLEARALAEAGHPGDAAVQIAAVLPRILAIQHAPLVAEARAEHAACVLAQAEVAAAAPQLDVGAQRPVSDAALEAALAEISRAAAYFGEHDFVSKHEAATRTQAGLLRTLGRPEPEDDGPARRAAALRKSAIMRPALGLGDVREGKRSALAVDLDQIQAKRRRSERDMFTFA